MKQIEVSELERKERKEEGPKLKERWRVLEVNSRKYGGRRRKEGRKEGKRQK